MIFGPTREHPPAHVHAFKGHRSEVMLPLALFPALADAKPTELADLELLGSGSCLNWERLDVQYIVPEAIREALGPWVLMQAVGSAGGSVRSKAKAVAARENGKKGGRPRKTAPT
jgi:hypothetical protein